VAWREQVGREKRAAYAGETYWARPVPGWGDPAAWLLIVGLAPGAHGSNRTGRPFTGDGSGAFLYPSLNRAGLANQPEARRVDDGLALTGAYVTAAVRCAPPANKPALDEWTRCRPYLERELDLLPGVRVIVCLGGFAWSRLLGLLRDRGHLSTGALPPFGHGRVLRAGPYQVLASFHPSQQNTFTGRLTAPMLDAIWEQAKALRDAPAG
jgi:uracil-DNA glycosylase family 4